MLRRRRSFCSKQCVRPQNHANTGDTSGSTRNRYLRRLPVVVLTGTHARVGLVAVWALFDRVAQLGGDHWVVTVSSHELHGCAIEKGGVLLYDLVDVWERGLHSRREPRRLARGGCALSRGGHCSDVADSRGDEETAKAISQGNPHQLFTDQEPTNCADTTSDVVRPHLTPAIVQLWL
jgi:hypothetical protein